MIFKEAGRNDNSMAIWRRRFLIFAAASVAGAAAAAGTSVPPAEAAPPPSSGNELTNEGDPSLHVSALGQCTWVNVTSTPDASNTLRAACSNNQDVIAGGCISSNASAVNYANGPYEGTDITNQPDDNEAYTALTATSGWFCNFNSASEMTAVALCCG